MSENFESKGVRLRPEQWRLCNQMCKEFGYKNYSEFFRDAVDFYADWKTRGTTERVITPEIESIVRKAIGKTEGRISRLLFKNTVELHLLTRLIYHDFNYKPEEVQAVRNEAIRLVSDTNGSLNLDYIDSV